MSSALLTNPVAIVPSTDVDFTDDEGKLVANNAGAFALNTSATVAARGVILEANAAAKQSSIGILGGFQGTVRVKLGGTVAKLDLLQQRTDSTVETDAGSGGRSIVGVALEAGVSGDLIEAVLFSPRLAS